MLTAVTKRAAVFVPVPVERHIAAVEVVARRLATSRVDLRTAVRGAEEGGYRLAPRHRIARVPGRVTSFDVLDTNGVQRALFNVGKHNNESGVTPPSAANAAVFLQQRLIARVGQNFLRIVEVLSGETELLQVVRALHTTRGFTSCLNRRQ